MCMSPRCGESEIESTGPSKIPRPRHCALCGADLKAMELIICRIGRIERMLALMIISHQKQKDPGIPV